MDSIRSYGSQGLAYAKSNPITTVALIAAFVMAVLAIVVIFSCFRYGCISCIRCNCCFNQTFQKIIQQRLNITYTIV